jgi:septum formation protein
LGIPFSVVVPDVEELEDGDAAEVATANARLKAGAVDGECVLGVDTVVSLDGRIYGKPADIAEAAVTLQALSGRVHEVISGLCLVMSGNVESATANTRVRFRELDVRTIEWYLASGEWSERAGGYAIQGRGAALVASIEGDYLNVVGLPLATLLELAPWLVSDFLV